MLTVKFSKQDFRTYDPTNAIIKWSPMDAARKRRTKIQPYMAKGKKSSEACDSETFDIDIVDDELKMAWLLRGMPTPSP